MSQLRRPLSSDGVAPHRTTVSAAAEAPAGAPDGHWHAGTVVASRFRLESRQRRGRFGPIYRALDLAAPSGRQRVALQELNARIAARPPLLTALAQCVKDPRSWSHPNLAKILAVGRDGARTYLVSELLEGASLRTVLDDPAPEPLSLEEVLAVLRSVGDALKYAHAKGFVHGELGPEDVFVTRDYAVKVRELWPLTCPRAAPYFVEDLSAPGTLDVRDDVYGLACLAYELLACRHPYNGNSAIEALRGGVTPLPLAVLGPERWEALARGLALRRDGRTSSVGELLAAVGVRGTETLVAPAPARVAEPQPTRAPAGAAPAPLRARRRAPVTARPRSVARPVMALMLTGAAAAIVYQQHAWLRLHAADLMEVAVTTGLARLARTTETPTVVPEPRANREPRAADSIRSPSAAAETPAPVATAPTAETPSAASEDATAGVAPPRSAASSAPELRLAAASLTVSEADAGARVVVQRSGMLGENASVTWWTSDGDATADSDYADLGVRIERFAQGASTLTILVPLIADSDPEGRERFFVHVRPAERGAGASPATLRAEVVVIDDD